MGEMLVGASLDRLATDFLDPLSETPEVEEKPQKIQSVVQQMSYPAPRFNRKRSTFTKTRNPWGSAQLSVPGFAKKQFVIAESPDRGFSKQIRKVRAALKASK